jgi:leucyl-tRNA synthetase
MSKKYDPRAVEKKWQKFWKEKKVFKATVDHAKPKYYVLDMFPYPSGAGLHVGHVTGYTGTDIIARYKRQKGFNVLHPMGWDSFGLPAEQFAIRTGTHPAVTTKTNIDTYRRQLESLGFSYDWDREVATSDPDYYKWTQWIFTKLFEKGLAYEAEINVNFCPALGTVLANEEVENGRSKEGGYPIERRPLKQWILKITAYADRLLADLDLLDWPDHLKKLQSNWIGRSEGAVVTFVEECTHEPIVIFTTRPNTLFGATYLVLAPEHPLIAQITTPGQREEVEEYQKKTAAKSDLDRTDLAKEKSGVWTGTYATEPTTGRKVPIWIADYVLMGYGTGAIMAVPAHDERDFEFAEIYKLPVVCVYDPDLSVLPEDNLLSPAQVREAVLQGKMCWTKEGRAIHSSNDTLSLNGLNIEAAKEKMILWLEQQGKGKRTVNYKLRDWLFSRQRYWGEPIPILHFADGTMRALGLDELPLVPPQLDDYKPAGTGQSPLAKVRGWVEITDPKTGKKALRETNTMPQWAGSCWYELRYLDPTNEAAFCDPEVERYWMGPRNPRDPGGVDLYVGGVEHAVLHLLYARFWHKVLYDLGHVSSWEPYRRLYNQGYIQAYAYRDQRGQIVEAAEVTETENGFRWHGQPVVREFGKMGKSLKNSVNPDELYAEYGADTFRLYEMSMAPLDVSRPWETRAVVCMFRFLQRLWRNLIDEQSGALRVHERPADDTTRQLLHRTIAEVREDLTDLRFNTAVAKLITLNNHLTGVAAGTGSPREVAEPLVLMLAPFAPHIAEELWARLGHADSLAYAAFPTADPALVTADQLEYPVQINGKVRARLQLPANTERTAVQEAALQHPRVVELLAGAAPRKIIVVPGRLVSIVV